MPLQVIKSTDTGVPEVVYTPPHPASIASSVPVPKFSEVESSLEVIKTASPGCDEWGTALDTIERFIYTR